MKLFLLSALLLLTCDQVFASFCATKSINRDIPRIPERLGSQARFLPLPQARFWTGMKFATRGISYCIQASDALISSFQSDIEGAAKEWLEVIREERYPFVPTIVYREKCYVTEDCSGQCPAHSVRNAQVVVRISPDPGRSYVKYPGNLMQLHADDDFAIILHEWGHVFGLADTYKPDPGLSGDCYEGQPNSIMCSAAHFSTLQSDDIEGIRNVYNNWFQSASACDKNPKSSVDCNCNHPDLRYRPVSCNSWRSTVLW